MKRPFRVWSADRSKRYGIAADNFQMLVSNSAQKFGLNPDSIKLVLEEDGTHIDAFFWDQLKDHTRLILLQPSEIWQPQSVWLPGVRQNISDQVDGNTNEKAIAESLFLNLQQNPSLMVLLNLSEMEIIKDADIDIFDNTGINKEMARKLQEICVDFYFDKRKNNEALELIDVIKQNYPDLHM